MKTVTKNLYIDGDYGSIERYGNVSRDDSEMKRMTMDFNQYLTNAPPVEKWSEKNNMLSFSPECVVSEEVKTLKSNEEEEGLSYKKEIVFYKVINSFPKIVGSKLSSGIEDVSYTLDMNELKD